VIRRAVAILGVVLVVAAAAGAVLRLTSRGHHGGRPGVTGAIPGRGGSRGAGTGRTFYVSSRGHDSSAGTSPSAAWRTVTAVDRAQLRPGDTVLFQGGATFTDEALMPGWGSSASGRPGAPITFGSYGRGLATLVRGVWFRGDDYLTFHDLRLGSASGISGRGLEGTGNHIRIAHLRIAHAALAIESVGDDWAIVDNDIRQTGDSGMLLGFNAGEPGDPPGGSDYLVTGNTIDDTGLDPRITFGTHGIYLKVTRATVTDNAIAHFHDDGISLRYRNNVVTGNRISHGPIGLAWFQYDDRPGTSTWHDNTLTQISDAGIFVCGTGQGCRRPLERFSIAGNAFHGLPRVPAIVTPFSTSP
jgi:hypothetical protein